MKLEKEGKILPMVTHDENNKDTYKNVTLMINIPELTNEEMKIIRKGQVSKIKLTLEIEKPILDEAERKYLSGVIRPFRDIVKGISKMKSVSKENMEYILITLADTECSYMAFPYFKKEKMYKNLELGKEYKLEDLEL